ncbi:unnamed protein product [Soboliphyme baturini]|uniref:NADAR domain-containing protein n=1 Tax=Soboliphyme baturini TaxID=241478 RepID=A0A183IXR3_9BILA|nr:unnamed protein product [Soboliphyme baturini]
MEELTGGGAFVPIDCGEHPLSAFAVVSLTVDGQKVASFIHYWYIRLCQLLGQETEDDKLRLSPFQLYRQVMNHILPSYYARSSVQSDGNFVKTTINVTKSILRKFLLVRFDEDASLKEQLRLTSNDTIVECNADRMFGINRSYAQLLRWLHYVDRQGRDTTLLSRLFHLNIFRCDSTERWFGANLNGVVLMELRRELFAGADDVKDSVSDGILPTIEVPLASAVVDTDDANDITEAGPVSSQDKFLALWRDSSHSAFYCHDMMYHLDLLPLQNSFAPLAVSYQMPILAGETLYPSVEHYVAAQYFRDVQRLDAARGITLITNRFKLREFVAQVTHDVSSEQVQQWRKNRMYLALKAAVELKFAQYPELNDLLMLTGIRTLIEVDPGDTDWSIGMSWMTLRSWMATEKVNPLMLLFWFLHPDDKPGIVGLNYGGRLLMEMRQRLLEERNYGKKKAMNERESLKCPICYTQTVEGAPSLPWTDQIVVLHRTNPLAFSYPSAFMLEGEMYYSVEHYVRRKILEHFEFGDDAEEVHNDDAASSRRDCQEFDPYTDCTDFLWDRRWHGFYEKSVWPKKDKLQEWVEKYGLELYERALKGKFTQNRFCQELLINTGDALLVEIRASTGNDDEKGRKKARSAPKLLSSSWQNGAEVVRLPRLGKNLLGLLLMKVRFLLRNQDALKQASFETSFAASLSVVSLFMPKLNNCFGLLYEDGFSPVDCHFSPLSPHYFAPFSVDSVSFPTVEHFLWYSLFTGHVPKYQAHYRFIKCLLECQNTHLLPQLVYAYVSDKFDREVTNELMIFADLQLQSFYEIGTRAKFMQNDHLLPALFERFDVPFFVGDPKNSETARFRSTVALEGWMKKWQFSLKNVLYWWLHPLFKPSGFVTNAAGMALMVVRSELIQKHGVVWSDVSSDDKCNAFEGLSNFTVPPNRLFVFDSSHPFSPTFIAPFRVFNEEFRSVVHFYWSRGLKAIGVDQETAAYLLSLPPERCNSECLKVAATNNIGFRHWQNREMKSVMLKGLKLKFDRAETLRRMLLSTEGMLLVYGDVDAVLGVGMTPPQLDVFCRQVGVDACLLKMWLCNGGDGCAACVGQNFCGLCLMELRQQLCEQPSFDVRSVTCSAFISPKNIITLDATPKQVVPSFFALPHTLENCLVLIGILPVIFRRLINQFFLTRYHEIKLTAVNSLFMLP